jgi:signal transduction histidine kinase
MRRLRWQLTVSHLIAIAFTLVSMVAAIAVIASGWLSSQSSLARRPAEAARVVAQAISGMVENVAPEDLDTVLRVLAGGQLRMPAPNGPPQRANFGDPGVDRAAYVVVVDPSGRPLASSMPQGQAFAPPEQTDWAGLASQAMDSQHDLPVLQRGTLSLGAAPVVDGTGRPVAAVIVAMPQAGQDERAGFWPLAFFGVATVAVLAASSVFALVAASIVGYVLARRLVRRLEQLSASAEALRGGNLAVRVPVAGSDEVSQLQQSFNSMAANLERTMGDLAAERDRVTGLLEAQRQLVAGVSHELRTPVATVRGYLESALHRDGALSADLKADLDTAEREAQRLEGLIDDLFTLSRAQVGRLELRLEPTDVGSLVRRQVETYGALAWRQRQVQVLAEVPPEGPIAQVDAQRVAQIVSNLLSNAIRHTPPGGLVAAHVAEDEDGVRIEVRDTGEGIPDEALPRVFERFYRGSNSHAGSGLGLTLVKELAESMAGSVDVHSTLGEGTTFTVALPAYHPPGGLPSRS